jgi:hypothetical protein
MESLYGKVGFGSKSKAAEVVTAWAVSVANL